MRWQKEVFCKYYDDTACCLSFEGINIKLKKEYTMMRDRKKRLGKRGGKGHKEAKLFKDLVKRKDKIFQVFLEPDIEGENETIRTCEEK